MPRAPVLGFRIAATVLAWAPPLRPRRRRMGCRCRSRAPTTGVLDPGAPSATRPCPPGATPWSCGSRPGGDIQRMTTVRGNYGVPLVAYDGTASGLSGDGRTLVLIQPRHGFPRRTTEFTVLAAERLRPRQRVTLDGDFSFDALSPDGRPCTSSTTPTLATRPPMRFARTTSSAAGSCPSRSSTPTRPASRWPDSRRPGRRARTAAGPTRSTDRRRDHTLHPRARHRARDGRVHRPRRARRAAATSTGSASSRARTAPRWRSSTAACRWRAWTRHVRGHRQPGGGRGRLAADDSGGGAMAPWIARRGRGGLAGAGRSCACAAAPATRISAAERDLEQRWRPMRGGRASGRGARPAR